MDEVVVKKVENFPTAGQATIENVRTGDRDEVTIGIDALFNHLIKRLEGIEAYLKHQWRG